MNACMSLQAIQERDVKEMVRRVFSSRAEDILMMLHSKRKADGRIHLKNVGKENSYFYQEIRQSHS